MGSVESSVFVKVIRIPEIKEIPPIEKMKDDNVVLECHYKSDGLTTAKWYFNELISTLEEFNDEINNNESKSDEETEYNSEKVCLLSYESLHEYT